MSSICTFPVYREAATSLRRNGWVQWKWHKGKKRCMMQAVLDAGGAAPDGEVAPRIVNELHAYLMRLPSYTALWYSQLDPRREPASYDMTNWNDAKDRTLAEVLSVLDSIADKLELEWRRDQEARTLARITELQAEVRRLKAENASLYHRLGRFMRGGRVKSDAHLGSIESELRELLDTEASTPALMPAG